ncbi:GNAT family N-acetyltransferase [Rhodovulum sp. DZ06]|uniref:GNAT family N-acetyltransferase n=1 Tax=Rhodovulum sp. DZ06 TaxID=3425126 RepID=UPI003D33CE26
MAPAPFVIRGAREDDAPALARIYWRAGALFIDTAHPEVVDPDPPAAALFARLARQGALLVAAAGGDRPAGFLGWMPATLLDGTPALHVGELDMDPALHGRGGGTMLLRAAEALARRTGRGAVTLSTFIDVPWNAPFYARRGYHVMDPADWPPVCRGEVERMAAAGQDVSARVVMMRRV